MIRKIRNLFDCICIGLLFSALFIVLIKIFFEIEWTYLFYGILILMLVIIAIVKRSLRKSLLYLAASAIAYVTFVLLFFIITAIFGHSQVDIRHYLASSVASTLHHYRSTINEDQTFTDINMSVMYKSVTPGDVQKVLDKKSSEIWKTCSSTWKKESKTICYDNWMTIKDMQELQAISDPRYMLQGESADLQELIKKFENDPGTLCSLRATPHTFTLSSGEVINALQNTDSVSYLCLNKEQGIILFQIWST